MCEILFRGKRIDNGAWIIGHLLRYEDGRARINAPTVDAVEVVRCKDCIYHENGCCINSESYDDTRYRPDYFCADGERRNDERL